MGRAIVRDPKVFLFDEPLSNLDAKLRVAMRAEIKALHQRLKTTTVYVTHDQVEAMTMADRIVVMQDGRIEQIGTPLELYDRPANLFVAQFIGSPAMNVVDGTLRRSDGAAWVEAEGGARWPLAPAVRAPTARRSPTACGPSTSSLGARRPSVPAEVIVVEPTGAETELLVQVGAAQIVVVMHGRTDVAARRDGSASRSTPAPSTCSIRRAADRSPSRTPRAAPPSGPPSRGRSSSRRPALRAASAASAARPAPC